MVYILSRNPHNRDERPFSKAYDEIVRECRRHPSWQVKVLVPAQVDALCASQLLLSLFSKDDVQYTIIPVSGYPNLTQVRDELLQSQQQIHTIMLINIGSFLEITSEAWFGEFSSRITVHIIDSARPFELRNLFGQPSEETDPEKGPPRVTVWDDGHADKLVKEREAFERLEYGVLEDSDGSDTESDEELDSTEDDEPFSDGERTPGQRTKKRRRSPTDEGGKRRRRRRTLEGSAAIVTRDEQEEFEDILANHFNSGSHHGQSAAGIMYRLCMDKGFADNELLWLAILGLTSQYLASAMTHAQYDVEYQTYEDEVARLNVDLNIPSSGAGDDAGVRPSKEFRLILLQQWTLYDAMLHSGYVANKLGTWKEEGRGRLQRMLAKMGLSIQQYQQAYTYMDLQLRQQLPDQFDNIAGEVGLLDLSYMTFTKSYGYEMARTCAADVVAGIQALLESAVGVRIYVPTEGGSGGGELFGPKRLWDLRREGPSRGKEAVVSKTTEEKNRAEDGEKDEEEEKMLDGEKVWQTNFWIAFDALAYNTNLRQSMTLAKALQEAIVRQGCAILEKKTIKYYREFRLIRIEEGPDLTIFSHPATLSRLALWLVEATRDRIPAILANKYAAQSKKQKKSLPFVIGCLNERANSYIVVGITGAPEIGQVRKNHFGLAFLAAKERAHARTRHGTFETSAVEVNRSDFKAFISALADE